MNEQNYRELLAFATDVASQAGDLILDFRKRRLEKEWTSARHFKTAADDASDALMRHLIGERFSGHNILSEEGSPHMQGSPFTWVLDGVDGTIGFATGINNHFSVCVGLCENGVPVVGAVNAVGRGELYAAAKGVGAFLNGKPIRVSDCTEVNQVLMGIDSGKENKDSNIPYLVRLKASDGVSCAMMSGCASVPMVLVASGAMQAYLATSLAPEDMAAAVPIIREAGGKVTNLAGDEWILGDSSILAANLVLHGKLFEMVSAIPGRFLGSLAERKGGTK